MKISSLSRNNYFSLINFANWPQLEELLGLVENNSQNQEFLRDTVEHQIAVIDQDELPVSGLVLDPELSLPLALNQKIDLPWAAMLHKAQAEFDPLSLPPMLKNWSIQEIANNMVPVYINFLYNPGDETALKKKHFLAEIADYAHHEGIDLILDLEIFTRADQEFSWEVFREEQLEAVHELQGFADLLVLQYPQDSLWSATLTTELDVPWLVSDRGFSYADYKDALRDALENGAKGFLAASSLWSDLSDKRKENQLLDSKQMMDFNVSTFRDEVIELSRIVDEYAADST